jgi:lysophospholipase L1-like esterase
LEIAVDHSVVQEVCSLGPVRPIEEAEANMLYAALGDSITFGYSSTSEDKRYVHQVQTSLSKQQRINLYVHAKPGWTSKQLLKSLQDVPDCIWDEAGLVTLMIGGNDLLRVTPWLIDGSRGPLMKAADRLLENISKIVEIVERPGSKIVIATLYNPFPNSIVAEECVETLNKAIKAAARRHKLLIADVRQNYFGKEDRFVDRYKRGNIRDFRIRNNPIHPNDAGHLAIARTILGVYRRAIARSRVKRTKSK